MTKRLVAMFGLILSVSSPCSFAQEISPAYKNEQPKALAVNAQLPRPLKFCGDAAGWPPYTFEFGSEIKGYDIDVLEALLGKQGKNYRVHMLPWLRCLRNVEQGVFDVALSASGTPERAATFRLTPTYYQVQPSFVYFKPRFPEGLDLPSIKAVETFNVCGLRGYSYSSFKVPESHIDSSSNNFRQLFNKTAAGRCDLLLARLEILYGFAQLGTPLMSKSWGYTAVPGVPADLFHMLVSRAIPDSKQVHQLLSDGINRLKDDGTLDKLESRYIDRSGL